MEGFGAATDSSEINVESVAPVHPEMTSRDSRTTIALAAGFRPETCDRCVTLVAALVSSVAVPHASLSNALISSVTLLHFPSSWRETVATSVEIFGTVNAARSAAEPLVADI